MLNKCWSANDDQRMMANHAKPQIDQKHMVETTTCQQMVVTQRWLTNADQKLMVNQLCQKNHDQQKRSKQC